MKNVLKRNENVHRVSMTAARFTARTTTVTVSYVENSKPRSKLPDYICFQCVTERHSNAANDEIIRPMSLKYNFE